MNIGIIGAGAAGLTAAWLLNENHNVTIFEKESRLGGHAHTIEVATDGEVIPIESGFEFFAQGMWPVFCRLLKILDVPIHVYAVTATFYTTDNSRVYRMPLVRNGGVNWSTFKPRQLFTMLWFRRALRRAESLIRSGDTSITLEEFVEGLNLNRPFKDKFLYPLLLAGWCIEIEDFKRLAAYNVLKYLVWREVGRFSQTYSTEIVGGSRIYIDALARASKRARIRLSSTIRRLMRHGDSYVVEESGGARREFDHLIIATNARQAFELTANLSGVEALWRELNKVEYFKTSIAIHGDRRLMPSDEKHWSVINIRFDGARSSNTIWKRWRSGRPIFRSWVTHDAQLPDPLYHLETYEHPKPTPEYFKTQKALGALQGQNNLWLAGVYTHDIDSHESAIISAIKIAQRLDPLSLNLKRLAFEETKEPDRSLIEKARDRWLQPTSQSEY
jgi:predicted NAD/FAD-binding protein